jgi:chloride intracellular channel protein 2
LFQDKEVATLIENLYTKFKMYVTKFESTDSKEASQPLFSHLERINDFMAKRGTRFLTGDTMSCFDCELMPRLQHIRIGAKAFRKFEIPTRFAALWTYMANMYELEAFRQSCPADQDIISHIKNQLGLRTTARIELETPIFTTSIPIVAET